MGADGTAEIVALSLTFLVHVGGAVLLVWAMFDGSEREQGGWRGWWPRDDDPPPPDPGPDEPRRGLVAPLPLPDSDPSSVRLREPGRVADRHPRPGRRPAHPPSRTPERVPR